jgi:hypothetical protein
MSNFVPATVIGMGGYSYNYADKMGSMACNDANALCGAGMTAAKDTAGMIWGAGIGFNLNQMMATGSASPPINMFAVPTTAKGIAYGLSALPTQGARLIIDQAGADYCFTMAAGTGNVPWAMFNTKCWDNSGTALTGAPSMATHIQFQVNAATAAGSFDFCVTSVSFM